MLSRLPVMAPIGWRLDCEAPTETRPLINTAPQKTAPQKPPPRETAALFKEVLSALEAGRVREGKWTTQHEARLLCEYWAQLATRCSQPFTIDGFSERAVTCKLQSMEKLLPESLFKLPLHTPEVQLGEVLADCRLLATEHGRKQAGADGRGGEVWAQSTPTQMEIDDAPPSLALLAKRAGYMNGSVPVLLERAFKQYSLRSPFEN